MGGGRKHGGKGGGKGAQRAIVRRLFGKNAPPLFQSPDRPSADICCLCTEQMDYCMVGPCNHAICCTCGLRLRYLVENQECQICRTQCDQVIMMNHTQFVEDFGEDFEVALQWCKDNKTPWDSELDDIWFGDEIVVADVFSLLEYKCWYPECMEWSRGAPERQAGYRTIRELMQHVYEKHGKKFCETCMLNRHSFVSEQYVYSPEMLKLHSVHGDPADGEDPAIDAHAVCEYCDFQCFNLEALYLHLRKTHEHCYICHRQGKTNQYIPNYPYLETHYAADHFLCDHEDCRDKQPPEVFETEQELRAHQQRLRKNMSTLICTFDIVKSF